MIPLKTIEELISKHSLLEKELSTGEIDKKLFAEKSKEYSDLNDIISDAKKYFSYEGEKKDLEKILDDSDGDDEDNEGGTATPVSKKGFANKKKDDKADKIVVTTIDLVRPNCRSRSDTCSAATVWR